MTRTEALAAPQIGSPRLSFSCNRWLFGEGLSADALLAFELQFEQFQSRAAAADDLQRVASAYASLSLTWDQLCPEQPASARNPTALSAS